MKLTVCWTARGRNKRFYHDICRKFGISDYMSINHETPCDIKDEDMELLRECEKRGFLQIRKSNEYSGIPNSLHRENRKQKNTFPMQAMSVVQQKISGLFFMEDRRRMLLCSGYYCN